jgi:hypothetical protein
VRLREFEPTLRVPVCCLGNLDTDQLAKRTPSYNPTYYLIVYLIYIFF